MLETAAGNGGGRDGGGRDGSGGDGGKDNGFSGGSAGGEKVVKCGGVAGSERGL